MTEKKWKETIISKCRAVGTYRDSFEPVIDSLAAILAQRDKTRAEFRKSGGKSVMEYTNKNGSTNLIKNPLLVLWNDQNQTALSYWRDLGLTPAGLKKLNEKAMEPPKRSALSEALKNLG